MAMPQFRVSTAEITTSIAVASAGGKDRAGVPRSLRSLRIRSCLSREAKIPHPPSSRYGQRSS